LKQRSKPTELFLVKKNASLIHLHQVIKQQGISLLQDVLKDLKSSQKTILIVTHSFEQGMEDVDRILIINKGQIAADFPTENLQAGDLKRIYVEKVAS